MFTVFQIFSRNSLIFHECIFRSRIKNSDCRSGAVVTQERHTEVVINPLCEVVTLPYFGVSDGYTEKITSSVRANLCASKKSQVL
jgi:hypothetical protein